MKVGLLGYGYWGKNWARVARDMGALGWVYDPDPCRREAIGREVGGRFVREDPGLNDARVDGLILSTPPTSHADLTIAALRAGKHVLVEKPMATRVADAWDMVTEAESRNLTLMVGYTFLYSQPIRDFLEAAGTIGDLRLARFTWANRGIVREDVDVWWNVGPHLLSVLSQIADLPPFGVTASAGAWLSPDRADVAQVGLSLPGGMRAEFTVSWLDPVKTRKITLIGSEGEIVCNPTGSGLAVFKNDGETLDTVAPGDGPEALALELADFLAAMENGVEPRGSAALGLKIQETMELVDEAIGESLFPGLTEGAAV